MKSETEGILLAKKYETVEQTGYSAYYRHGAEKTSTNVHYHDYYEIIFYLGSQPCRFEYMGEMYTLRRGDIVPVDLFKPHLFHLEEGQNAERFLVGFDGSFLTQYSFEGTNLLDLFPKKAGDPVLHTSIRSFGRYLDLIIEYMEMSPDQPRKELLQRAILYRILSLLYAEFADAGITGPEKARQVNLVSSIVVFIDRHLTEKLTLSRIASEVNYSVTYISKTFKEISGDTLTNYIIKKRIERAELLLMSDEPINVVAEKAGFANYSYFYRVFRKKTGVSPQEYRLAQADVTARKTFWPMESQHWKS